MDLQIKGNWDKLREQLVEKYGELTDEDLRTIHGKAEELIAVLKEKTGKSKETIEEELIELDSKLL